MNVSTLIDALSQDERIALYQSLTDRLNVPFSPAAYPLTSAELFYMKKGDKITAIRMLKARFTHLNLAQAKKVVEYGLDVEKAKDILVFGK